MSTIDVAESDSNTLLKAIYDKLNHIESRLSLVEFAVTGSQGVIATSVDSIDQIMTTPSNNLKVEKIQHIAKKLSSEQMLDRFSDLLDKIESVAPLVEHNNPVNTLDFIVDSIDDIFMRLKLKGIDVASLIQVLTKIPDLIYENNEKLTHLTNDVISLVDLDKFQKMLDGIKTSFSEANKQQGNVGILDILKNLNDPEVKKQVLFSLLAIKSISKAISK